MKCQRRVYSLISLVMVFTVILLTGCKENSAEVDVENAFLYDGESYTLAAGLAVDFGVWTPGYRNYLFVLSEKSEDISAGVLDSINSAHIIVMDLESFGETSFDGGTFDFSLEGTSQVNIFQSANLAFFTNGEVTDDYYALSGSADVNIQGENYTIEFNLNLENGKKLRGHYSGMIPVYDDSTMMKLNSSWYQEKFSP